MPTPSGDLQSKINRAIKAYLVTAGVVTVQDCHAQPDSYERTLPLTEIGTGDGIEFEGLGNWQFPSVTLKLEDTGIVQPTVPNQNQPRIDANTRMTAIWNALNLSDDATTLDYVARQVTAAAWAKAIADPVDNGDLADFTMIKWYVGDRGGPQQKTEAGMTFWERVISFSCVACDAALTP